MTDIERFKRAAMWCERVNTITMFVLPPATAIYGVWSDEWRPFQSSMVICVTVFIVGLLIVSAKDRAEKSEAR